MVAVLENAMWREMHDYRFQLGALKVYKYLTHAGVHDPEQAADWWFETLPNATAVKNNVNMATGARSTACQSIGSIGDNPAC